MADYEILSLNPTAQVEEPTAQIVSPTATDRGKLVPGALISGVPDSASAEGWSIDTPLYTAAGAKLLVIKNNGVEQFSIDLNGALDGQLLSNAPDGPTSVAWTLDGPDYTDAGSKLFSLKNNGVEKFSVDLNGIPTFPGSSSVVPANQIVINQESDFANQDATTITLENGKVYLFGESVTTFKRFIINAGDGVTLTGTGLLAPTLTYAGTGDMFTVTDAAFEIISLRMTSPLAAQTFVLTAPSSVNTQSFNLSYCIFEQANKLGTLTNLNSIVIRDISFQVLLDGFSMIETGSVDRSLFSFAECIMVGVSASAVLFDLTDVTYISILFRNASLFAAVPGVVGISGLIDSGNVPVGTQGGIQSIQFLGQITPLVNIDPMDLRWEVTDSSPISNSTRSVDAYLSATQNVVIGTQSAFVPIGGTNWLTDVNDRFTVDTDGLITYVSPIPSKCQVLMSSSLAKDGGGGGEQIDLAIAINDTVIVKTITSTKNSDPSSLTSIGLFDLSETDTIQAYVTNQDGTTDIDVFSCSVIIINGF